MTINKYYSLKLTPVCNKLMLELINLSKEFQFQLTKDNDPVSMNKHLNGIVYSYLKYHKLKRCTNRDKNEIDFEHALWSYLVKVNPDIDFVSTRTMLDEDGYMVALPSIAEIVTTNVIACLSECCDQCILSPLGYREDVDWLEWRLDYTAPSTVLLVCLGDYRIKRYHELVKNGIITQ